MDHFPLNWGKPRVDGEAYNPYPSHGPSMGRGPNYVASVPKSFTQQPIVTGTSVIALKYRDGIIMATDCLASYGSLARFRDLQRVKKVGDLALIGASGDISDFQHVSHVLDQLMTEERIVDDGHILNAIQVYEYMSNIMYNRRSKMNPLWNAFVVAGVAKGERFLGYVDLLGTTYQSPSIATGFGAHLAQPLLRKALEGGREDTLTEGEAKNIVKDCMRVLYYRDARSLNKFHLAKADARGVTIEGPMSVETEWGFAKDISGYGA